MAIVDFEEGALRIDATVIGRGLNVEPSLVQVRMREGKITVLCVESMRTLDAIA
jgi:hypothetical protein